MIDSNIPLPHSSPVFERVSCNTTSLVCASVMRNGKEALLQRILRHFLLRWDAISSNGLDTFGIKDWFEVIRILVLEAHIAFLG